MEKAAHSIHFCEDGWNLGAMHQTEGLVTLAEIASQSAAAQRAGGPLTARPCQGQR